MFLCAFCAIIAAVCTFLYTKVYPTYLPPEEYKSIQDLAKVAKRKDKKAIKQQVVTARRAENTGLKATFGNDENGNPISLNIVKTPCVFIAGMQGMGKTNLLNNILLSIADWTRNVSFYIMTPPKGVKFNQYKKHLLSHKVKVANELDAWEEFVDELTDEHARREKFIASAAEKNISIEDISSYNKAHPNERLPYIIYVVDEASLLSKGEAKKTILKKLREIIRLGRSSGIYGIIADQTAQAEELTGGLLKLLPGKIALRLDSAKTSKDFLDQRGAEKLNPDKGEAIIKSPNHDCVKFTNPRVPPEKVNSLIKKITKKWMIA